MFYKFGLFTDRNISLQNMRKYLVLLFISFGSIPFVFNQTLDCPAGWSSSRTDPTSPCYLITNKIQRTWADAQTFCEQMGGGLWKIDDLAEKNWVYNLINVYKAYYPTHSEWWIGLHDNPAQNGVMWVDRSLPNMQLLQWMPGEPTQYDRSNACVEYNNGSLQHANCQQTKYFICERSRSSAVFCDARNNWESINQKCYKVITKLRTWDDARGECQAENGDLMVVEDLSTETVAYNFIESRSAEMWIGLRAFQSSNNGYNFQWLTSTGKQLDQTNAYWASDIQLTSAAIQIVSSSNGSSACVMANHSLPTPNFWRPVDCGLRAFSLCQKPQGSCASGWIANGYKCYQINSRYQTSWSNADAYCKQEGAQLITIKSQLRQDFVNSFLPNLKAQGVNSIWIGLSDKNSGSWSWSDGTTFVKSPYVYGNLNGQNPVNTPGVMDCFNIFTDDGNGTWQLASNCSNNQSFICEIWQGTPPKLPSTSTPPIGITTPAPGPSTTVTWSSDCGPFWVKDADTGYCYQFSDNTVTWFQAQSTCRSMDAQLASINNYHEEKFIADRLFGFTAPALWIGINNLNSHEGYHWVDGTGFGYLNWAPGEPNNVGNNEHCAEFVVGGPRRSMWNDVNCDAQRNFICKKKSKGEPNNFNGKEKCVEIIPRGSKLGQWNDNECNQQRGYVCKKKSKDFPTTPPPTMPTIPSGKLYGCPDSSWIGYKNNCFLFSKTTTNWINSRQYCQVHNAELASIADENEQNFVFSQLPEGSGYNDQFWIGMNDMDIQMKFQWTDNTTVTYTNWAENEPNNWQSRPEDCVAMLKQKDGMWNDYVCEDPLQGFICKIPKAILPSSTLQYNPSDGCPAGFLAYGYNCFQLFQAAASWTNAGNACRAMGGNLAVIKNKYQQAFLAAQVTGAIGYYWVGLSHAGQGGALQWVSGESVAYTAWSANHTGNANTSCIAMTASSPGAGLWWDVPCTTAHKYICETPRSGFSTALVTTSTTTAPPVCPPSWREYNGYCYKGGYSYAKKTYFEARDTCQAMGADLVSLHSSAEESFAFSYQVVGYYTSENSYWIGLNDFDVEKGYKWSDGTAVNYTNWGTGEPNDSDGTDDCVEYNRYSRNWNDNTCYVTNAFVCKVKKGAQLLTPQTTVQPTDPPECVSMPGWKLYNGSCYYVSQYSYDVNSRKNWFDARDYCLKQGGDLASVHSIQENNFLTTLVSKVGDDDCWIGLTDLGVNQFGWTDGTPLDYVHWNGNEPNDGFGAEKCGQLKSFNGYWNDNDCNDQYHFVCKRPQGQFTPGTPAPTNPPSGGCPSQFTAVTNDGRCYQLFGARDTNARANYTVARDNCRAYGTGYDIASVTNQIEQAAMLVLIYGMFLDNVGVWIGMNDLNGNNRFTWQDSSRVQYTNWDKSEPETNGGNCVEMYTDSRHAGKWHNVRCSDKRAYVCEARKDPSIPVTTPASTCALPGYVENSMDCYKLDPTPMSFNDAVASCKKDGTNLLSVLTVYEQAFLDTLAASVTSPVWIGLSDLQASGTYTWQDNNRVIFTSWDKNEPTFTATGTERCVATYNGFWNDTNCNNLYPYVCKKPFFGPVGPVTSPPTGYCQDSTWKQFGHFCYYLNLSPYYSYSMAESDCTGREMQLASVNSKEEENFILQLVDSDPKVSTDIWIGFRKKGGYFSWSDGTATSYVNWFRGPSAYDCVMMRFADGKWEDANCYMSKGYICKVPKLPATSPPPTTTTISTTTTKTTLSTTTPTTVTTTSRTTTTTIMTPVPAISSSSSVSTISQGSSSPATPAVSASSNVIPSVGPSKGIAVGTTVHIPSAAELQKQQQQQQQNKVPVDLSPGQIAGIVLGVFVLLAVTSCVLMFVKRRMNIPLFSFQRMNDQGGFDNAAYNKNMDRVHIKETSNGNVEKTSQNGHSFGINGHTVGALDFSDE